MRAAYCPLVFSVPEGFLNPSLQDDPRNGTGHIYEANKAKVVNHMSNIYHSTPKKACHTFRPSHFLLPSHVENCPAFRQQVEGFGTWYI